MYARLEKNWFILPALSGLLLVLSFHPFNLWPLGFVALSPLYYFVAAFKPSRARLFWAGCLTGGILSFFLSYFTIVQFHWLPEAYLFVGVVRLSVIPITLLGAATCGLSLLLSELRTSSFLFNISLGAAVYVCAEFLLQTVFGGYYLATLAYVAVPLTPLMGFAALGGAPLVSYVVAWVNAAVAEFAARGWPGRQMVLPVFACVALSLCLLVVQGVYLRGAVSRGSVSVMVLQEGLRDSGQFGTETKNGFSFPWLGDALTRAAQAKPDLIVYPFSPVEGALYREKVPLNKNVLIASETSFGSFTSQYLSTTTSLLTWNTLYDGAFHNNYQLWQNGRVSSEYQKRIPFPFMDYTPQWAQRIGLYSTPFDVAPGEGNHLMAAGIPLGALVCSEIHRPELAREDAQRAPLIIAAGSEAMFQDSVASAFSLRAAQFRAAENYVPVVRGNVLGPSGIIGPTGALLAYAPAGEEALIGLQVPLTEPRMTLYNRAGPALPLAIICGILLSTLWRRRSR